MNTVRWIGFGVGVILCCLNIGSLVGTLVVPRRTGSRIGKTTGRLSGYVFRVLTRRGSFEARDKILAYQAPVQLVSLFVAWILIFLAGFTLLFWPLIPAPDGWGGLGRAFTAAGSSLFTLGFAPESASVPVLTFLAAVSGLAVVALEIGYLPVLYAAFNRRETLVTMLDSRAGSPAWGPEILARAELVDNVGSLRDLYVHWEGWAADVAETHSTYPPLIFFRSPVADRSWIIGLLAVMDAAALHLATRPITAPAEASPFIRMGYMALRDVARVFAIPFNEDPKPDDPITLTREDFQAAWHHLEHVGWPFERDVGEAWIHFRGWRVTYETLAYRIADIVNAPPAVWSGPRRRLPTAQQPPTRPPHRAPGTKTQEMRQLTDERRRARGEAAGGPLPVEHEHELQTEGREG